MNYKVKLDLTISLDQNKELQVDLVLIRADRKKSPQWTTSLETLGHLTKMIQNTSEGMVFQRPQKCKAPRNPYCKCMSNPNNLLCTCCGRGHYKDNCKVFTFAKSENLSSVDTKGDLKRPGLKMKNRSTDLYKNKSHPIFVSLQVTQVNLYS